MAGKLSEPQTLAVDFIEKAYWMHGALPTNDVIAGIANTTPVTVAKWWNSDTFRLALQKRGIDLNPARSADLLTPEQLQVANMVLNLVDKRSMRAKLEEAGITPQKYAAWLRQPGFREYLNKRAEDLFQGSDYIAFKSLLQNAEEGDMKAVTLMLEMKGRYTPKQQMVVNIQSVMLQFVEVIQRHVHDPNTLQNIANDLERLVGGESGIPAPLPPPTDPSPDDFPPTTKKSLLTSL